MRHRTIVGAQSLEAFERVVLEALDEEWSIVQQIHCRPEDGYAMLMERYLQPEEPDLDECVPMAAEEEHAFSPDRIDATISELFQKAVAAETAARKANAEVGNGLTDRSERTQDSEVIRRQILARSAREAADEAFIEYRQALRFKEVKR